MGEPIIIRVINNSRFTQDIYCFQHPATYSGGLQVHVNSLYCETVYSGASQSWTIWCPGKTFAGVERQRSTPMDEHSLRRVNAVQRVDLTPESGAPANNMVTMSVAPLGFSAAAAANGLQPGSFRIVTPAFDPAHAGYNIGPVAHLDHGATVLSSFAGAPPDATVDCQPHKIFYVAIGRYSPGVALDFQTLSAGAAVFDATGEFTTFHATCLADGAWRVDQRR